MVLLENSDIYVHKYGEYILTTALVLVFRAFKISQDIPQASIVSTFGDETL